MRTHGGTLSPPAFRGRPRRPAMVLLVVLVVTVLLALAAYGFVVAVQSDHQAARAAADRMQTQHLLDSGQLYAGVWLAQPRAVRFAETGDGLPRPALSSITTNAGVSPQVVGWVDFRDPASAANDMASLSLTLPAADSGATLDNESGKLHLGTVMAWEMAEPGMGRSALLRLPGMTENTADAILDWLDKDNAPRPLGAEDEYYGALGLSPRNAIPTSLTDLLHVRDVTPAMLLGGTALSTSSLGSADTVADDISLGAPSQGGPADELPPGGWQSLLTVASAERNHTWTGAPRINVNDGDLQRLYPALTERLPQELANYIVAYRIHGPAEGEPPSDANTATYTPDLTQRPSHGINSLLDLLDSHVAVSLPEDETFYLASPLSVRAGGELASLGALLDQLTTSDQRRLVGRINLLDASPEVLRTLPGLDDAGVQFILQQRESPASRENLMWFWSTNAIPRETIERLSPWVTVGGDVYRMTLTVTHGPSGLRRQATMTLDASGESPRRITYRECWLASPGPHSF